MKGYFVAFCVSSLVPSSLVTTNGFSPTFTNTRVGSSSIQRQGATHSSLFTSFRNGRCTVRYAEPENEVVGGGSASNDDLPSFNGKMILPMRVIMGGLKGYEVTAVYAVYNDSYKRGEDGWNSVELIGITQNLEATLQSHLEKRSSEKVSHVRALSFQSNQLLAMEEVARQWHESVRGAGGSVAPITFVDGDDLREQQRIRDAAVYLHDDDDDDEYNFEVDLKAQESSATADAVVSPFDPNGNTIENDKESSTVALDFTAENVDKVLEQVRPYLISDGGNVSVEKVDLETRNVYLRLEGACGSCPSSTITMQMGIERTLREQFDGLGEVIAVDNADAAAGSTELTLEMVQAEINRLSPAIFAMGAVLEVVSVDPIGVVEVKFRGSNKVQHGLELALRDIPLVKHVKFVS